MSLTTSIDWNLAIPLVKACIQSQQAFHDAGDDDRATCYEVSDQYPVPDGYKRVDCFTGVTARNQEHPVECFGLVYQSQGTVGLPPTYIFSFRGSKSRPDWIYDLEFIGRKLPFVPFDRNARSMVPQGANVAHGFWSIYAGAQATTPSMQEQLFSLLHKYQPSQLYIAGHSLGGALCVLFTLDLALSEFGNIQYWNYNYGCPMVGNKVFADFYNSQPREQQTPTLRVQNVDDAVPCNPPPKDDYKHVGQAYLIGFHGPESRREERLLDNHMAQNYRPVLECARDTANGVCINDNVKVPSPTCTVTSFKPDPTKICAGTMLEPGAAAAGGVGIPDQP